jgi:two-component system chemotaxis response regulator CheB
MSSDPLSVLIVDDSLIFRSALEAALRDEPSIEIAGTARNGVKAMEFLRKRRVDLVTLDLEMPDMNGLQTLEAIQKLNGENGGPPVGAIMVSAHTWSGADSTIKALELGAFDFVAKPEGARASQSLATLRRELITKIRAFGLKARKWEAGLLTPVAHGAMPARRATTQAPAQAIGRGIVIGVSTGGPKALSDMLPELVHRVDAPILIAQHMSAMFTESMARSLTARCRKQVSEASNEGIVLPGSVWIAPGGRHLLIRRDVSGAVRTILSDAPPEHGYKPSVDILFRSAAVAFGAGAIAVVLTGMGTDGTKGLAPLRRAGARAIAQDEATSVVWGMPGSAMAAGLVDQVLPLMSIPEAIWALTEPA